MPPVLMCFGDQDSRVRYYACESMYNIAKVARGSILHYFNELFDAMSKVHDLFIYSHSHHLVLLRQILVKRTRTNLLHPITNSCTRTRSCR